MGPLRTLTIDIPTETAELLREVVASGEFADEGGAVNAALQEWSAQRDLIGSPSPPRSSRRAGETVDGYLDGVQTG